MDFSIRQDSEIYITRLMSSDQYDRAIEEICQALSQDPENAQLHLDLARCLVNLDQETAAIKEAKLALKIHPGLSYAHFLLAYVYFYHQSKANKAFSSIHEAIELDPQNSDYWDLLASIYLHTEDFKQANKCSEKSLSLNPNNLQARLTKVKVSAAPANKKAISATNQIELFTEILVEDPECVDAHIEIADTYKDRLHQYKKAIDHYETALKIRPHSPYAKKNIVDAASKDSILFRIIHAPRYLTALRLPVYRWIKARWYAYPLLIPYYVIAVIAFFINVVHYMTLWPLEVAYKYFTLADTRKRLGQLHLYRGVTAKLHKSPFYVRFSLLMAVWLSIAYFWYSAYAYNGTARIVAVSIVAIVVIIIRLLMLVGLLYFIYSFISGLIRKFRSASLLSK